MKDRPLAPEVAKLLHFESLMKLSAARKKPSTVRRSAKKAI